MLRIRLAAALPLFAFASLASEPSAADSNASVTEDRAEVVIVHFGDSTYITSYLPKDRMRPGLEQARVKRFRLPSRCEILS